jgi:serine/threonine-protein kinase RsbW
MAVETGYSTVLHNSRPAAEHEQVMPVAASDPGHPPGEHVVSTLWLTDVPATAAALTGVREQLTIWAVTAGLGDDQVDDVGLATYEAMANVVDHAYDHPGGVFDLHACRRDDQVTVTVTDHGQWKSPASGQERWRGRGLLIIERTTREFELSPRAGGTTVCMGWSILVDETNSGPATH